MPRPDRPWIKNTYTVSPEVDLAVRTRAASLRIDTGTAADAILWAALLKPSEAQLRAGGFSDDQLERIFAEEVLSQLEDDQAVRRLAEQVVLSETQGANLKLLRAMLMRWHKTRRIDKDQQSMLLTALQEGNWAPSILRLGLVDLDWFDPKEAPVTNDDLIFNEDE